ncbi:MAG: hypothetical protein EP329_03330 [Deltaproteobacteria bacterium]|nr:MAG: hypothetical protein EP329_03330 [Deltaproteobacteria bacterium]
MSKGAWGIVAGLGGVAAVVAVVLATSGGERPSAPTPPPETRTAPASADAAPASEKPENVVSELEQTWDEQAPKVPDHGLGPISDEDWPHHPCYRLVRIVTGAVPAADGEAQALIDDILKSRLRSQTLDVKTWTYAACAAVGRNDFAPCHATHMDDGLVPQRCVELANRARLVRRAGSVAECMGRLDLETEPEAFRQIIERLCRAEMGDAHACDDFPLRNYGWVCQAHLEGDLKACADIADPHARVECAVLVDMVRFGRGLPPQTGDALDPEMPLTLVYRKLVDPKLDCEAWYEDRMRDLCH